AREIEVDQRPVLATELRTESHETPAVRGVRDEWTRGEVLDARLDRQRLPWAGAQPIPGEHLQERRFLHVDFRAGRRAWNGVAEVAVVPGFAPDPLELRRATDEAARERVLRMVGDFPAQAIHAEVLRHSPRQLHLLV